MSEADLERLEAGWRQNSDRLDTIVKTQRMMIERMDSHYECIAELEERIDALEKKQ